MSFVVINVFMNDIRSMIILTKEDVIKSMDQLMDRDVNIFMKKYSYEYKTMENVTKNQFNILLYNYYKTYLFC